MSAHHKAIRQAAIRTLGTTPSASPQSPFTLEVDLHDKYKANPGRSEDFGQRGRIFAKERA